MIRRLIAAPELVLEHMAPPLVSLSRPHLAHRPHVTSLAEVLPPSWVRTRGTVRDFMPRFQYHI